jgi:hypothetical protein
MTTDVIPADIVERVRSEMLAGYERLITFTESPPFQALLSELYSRPPTERPAFVVNVILDSQAREARGVFVPDDILVLRSAFGDRRPTLFCLKKYLSADLHRYWQNVNITFDNPDSAGIASNEAHAWRKPLSAGIQAAVVANNIAAEN